MPQDLHLFPYMIQMLQVQTKAERHAFGQTVCKGIEDNPDFLDFIFFIEGANFHLGDHVHKQNMWSLAQAQAHKHQYRSLSV